MNALDREEFPEFLREFKTFAFPYSIYDALLTEKIMKYNLTQLNQCSNFSFYRRLFLPTVAPQSFTFDIPDSYYYHLNGLRIFYPNTAGGDESPAIKFQVRRVVKNQELQVVPYVEKLQSTPANNQKRRYLSYINCLFAWREQIHITVTGQDGTSPEFVDIMSDGFRIPLDYKAVR